MIQKPIITALFFTMSTTLCWAQNNQISSTGKVGIGTTYPENLLHVRTYSPESTPIYPSATNRGDALSVFEAHNNVVELGVANGLNARRAWILARHANTETYGTYYATLHLQPALDNTSQYRGVAIGYPASTAIPLQVGLAVSGNVGIGTIDPQAKLAVNGNILATEVKVKADILVPDYVFESNYELPKLADIEAFVREHKHLPEIPSAADIERDGLDLAEMNLLLLKKVEELTLYLIEVNEANRQTKEENKRLESRIYQLENQN